MYTTFTPEIEVPDFVASLRADRERQRARRRARRQNCGWEA
nr:MAG TPA: SWI/SNF-related matrix-associated actin-dependent regulator of-SNF complex, BAF complex, Chromatin [Caudoviricetes sp.]